MGKFRYPSRTNRIIKSLKFRMWLIEKIARSDSFAINVKVHGEITSMNPNAKFMLVKCNIIHSSNVAAHQGSESI